MKFSLHTTTLASFLAITLGTTGCSSSPEKISAAYVSPLQFQHYDCNQIRSELLRVNHRVVEVSGMQQKEADKDAVAMGVALVLFWPALFFLAGSDHSEELARLKGEYEALETAAIQKKCSVAEELEAARRSRESARHQADKARESSQEILD